MPVLAEPMAKRKPPNRDPIHIKLARLFAAKCPDRSMADIARAAGMSPQQLNYLMLGHTTQPRLGTLQAILDAIGSSLAEYERA